MTRLRLQPNVIYASVSDCFNQCGGGTYCTGLLNAPSSFTCECQSGLVSSSASGKHCAPSCINTCSSANSSCHSGLCTCNAGYLFLANGVDCAINNCTSGTALICPSNAACAFTGFGGSMCTCNSGYAAEMTASGPTCASNSSECCSDIIMTIGLSLTDLVHPPSPGLGHISVCLHYSGHCIWLALPRDGVDACSLSLGPIEAQ